MTLPHEINYYVYPLACRDRFDSFSKVFRLVIDRMGRAIGHSKQPVNLFLFRRGDCNGIPALRVQICTARRAAVIALTPRNIGPVGWRLYLPQMLLHELKCHYFFVHGRSKLGPGML